MAVRSRRRTSARGRTETLKGQYIRYQRETTGLHENVSSKDLLFHSQQRRLLATVRTEPSMTGGAQFGLLQYVGHIRPEWRSSRVALCRAIVSVLQFGGRGRRDSWDCWGCRDSRRRRDC